MSKSPDLLIEHIFDSIAWIEKITSGLDKESFFENVPTQDAVIRRLEIIGEAVRHLSSDLKESNPDTAWSDISDMRNKLIHEYFDVDLDLIWEVVKTDIPKLKTQLKKITH